MSVFQILGSLFFMISFMIIIIFLVQFRKINGACIAYGYQTSCFFIVWKEYSTVGWG